MVKLDLKDRINKGIKDKKEIVKVVKEDGFLDKIEFDSKKEYTQDIQLNKYLNAKTNLVKKVQATTSIFLGEVFEEVRNKIGSKYRGLYVEWLEDNGYNKMTALRHRNRYNIFRMCKTNEGKRLVAGFPQSIITKISGLKDEDENRAEILRAIDGGAAREEIECILKIEEEPGEDPEVLEIKDTVKITDILNVDKIKSITKYSDVKIYRKRINKIKKDLKISDNLLKDKEVELFNKDKEGVRKSQ